MNTTTKTELAEVSATDIATLPPAARAAVVLRSEQTRKELAALAAQSAGIITVLNADGREQAHRIGMTLKSARTAIEKTGKAAREDATAFSKAVIAEEKALIGLVQPEEDRVLKLRDGWDAEIAAEKAAKIAAERARVDAIQARIGNIAAIPASVLGMPSSYISDEFADLSDLEIDETFAEFREAAAAAKADALSKLDLMFNKAKELEAAARAAEEACKAEAARIEAERAELARLRAEQAERERLAKIEADRVAAEQAAEGKRIADRMAAEQAALQAERDRIAAEQARVAAELKAAQERLEADRAAHEARLQLEHDHADALVMNAYFDAAREAERERLQALADQLLADNRLPLPESVTVRDAMIDDDVPLEVSDEEVINAAIAAVEELGLVRDAAIDRLEAIDFTKARELVE